MPKKALYLGSRPKMVWYFFILALLSVSSNAYAKQKLPLWQAGVGVGALSLPHYPGSDQQYTFPLVFPSFVYRGDVIRTTRGGLRGLFYSSKNYAVDIGFAGRLPVYSKDNVARKGMPSITWIGEIGPRLVINLYNDGDGAKIHAHLPWRVVGGIDGTQAGWTLGPKIIFTNSNKLPWNLNAVLSLGLKYGSRKYNDLYYGVNKKYQTSSRAAYDASEGISWYSLSLSTGRWINNKFSIRLFLGWKTLAGSAIENSSLVRKKENISAGFLFQWLPFKSKRMESDKERMPELEEKTGA